MAESEYEFDNAAFARYLQIRNTRETGQYEFDDPKAAFGEAEKRIEYALKTRGLELDLRNLGLAELPGQVAELTGLREMRVSGNLLSALPETIGRLDRLRLLNISCNRLTSLPASIASLVQLDTVVAFGNELESLPEGIGKLRYLQTLRLYSNRLRDLPTSIGHLIKLIWLDVRDNHLAVLPETLRALRGLRYLLLHRNPELGLPAEVLGPDPYGNEISAPAVASPEAILDYYFRARAGGKRPLNEAKLILLGRGEVGKTCLVNRLVHNRFVPTSVTRGIAITQWPVGIGNDIVRLHVWDFGGQEIQHATHQFFLTERSLYLVVLNGRAGAEDEDAEYWLKFVKTFGASSPTLVVLNKFKVQRFQVNRRALLEKYPFIRAFVETDCKPKTKNGIPELKQELEFALEAMEHVRSDFPAGWFQIKERLAEMKEPFIAFTEYRKLCAGLGENDAQAQDRLAGFLNALGIALNFREDPQLRDETVLNPNWITEGVYRIITSRQLAERKGELRLADLRRILPTKAYPARMRGFLIGLMRKFELCFPFPDNAAERRYLVPELLGKEEPALKHPFAPGECLNFRYDYRLMPAGLLPRFMTRTHTMSDRSERWRTGVVLRWEGCRALVKADQHERQVIVRVHGEADKLPRLLAVIRQNFDEIHAQMREFKPTEWVALDEHPDEWISCRELEVLAQRQVKEFPKSVGDEVVSVRPTQLLKNTDVPRIRDRDRLGAGADGKLKLFISYAREDERWRKKLEPNLGLMRREGLIGYWHDRDLIPSAEWEEEIKRRLLESNIILFLVSVDLLNSDFIQRVELPMAMKMHRENQARVVPVVVRRCGWQRHFGEIEALPHGGRPISDWRLHDHACFDVEEGLRKTVADVRRILQS